MIYLNSQHDPDSLRQELVRLRFQLRDANARAELALSRLQETESDRVSSKRIPKPESNLLRSILRSIRLRLSHLTPSLHASGSSRRNNFGSDRPHSRKETQFSLERIRPFAKAKRPAILFISHGRGGGTDRHLQEMRSALATIDIPVFTLKSNPRRKGVLKFDAPGLGEASDLPEFVTPDDADALVHAIEVLGIKHIHVQHLADAGEGADEMVEIVARRAGIQYDVTVHDYMFVCPRITLIGASGLYCGEPDDAACNACLKLSSVGGAAGSIETWREQAQKFLSNARSVFVPSTDTTDRMRSYFPQVTFTVRPHFTNIKQQPHSPPAGRPKRRIATLGVLSPQKGARLLLETAKYAAAHEVPIEFVVIGYTSLAGELRALPNVTITGAYEEHDLGRVLSEHRPDLAWFPSLLPETFSYTLSSALGAGVFPVTFDIGAPAQRLRDLGWGAIMPLEYMLSVPDIVQYLLTAPIVPLPGDLAQSANVFYNSILADYYGCELEAIFHADTQDKS